MSVSLPIPRAEGIASRRFFDLELLDNRYPALHGMRVLAIASLVQHDLTTFLTVKANVAIGPQWASTSLAVSFGMDLFFVLSGFLIGSQLIRSIESVGSQRVRAFYMRRALRTIPPYYVLLTCFALIGHLTAAQRHHLWLEYAFLTNYRSGDLVLPWGWSLALVEQFYLGAPLLVFLVYKLATDRERLTALAALWGSALVVRLMMLLRHPGYGEHELYKFLYCRIHARFDIFVAGVAIAYVYHRWREPIARWLLSPRARACLALPSLACLWLMMHPLMFGWYGVPLMDVLSWGTLTSVLYGGWILLLLCGPAGSIRRGLSSRALRAVATLGFGVYLTYLPICEHVVGPLARSLVKDRAWPPAVVWPIAVASLFAMSLLAAYILHLLIEKPCRKRIAANYSGAGSTSSA